MEVHNRHRKDGNSYTLPLKRILINASKVDLWTNNSIGAILESSFTNFIPLINITKIFTQSFDQLIRDSTFLLKTEKYVKAVENSCNRKELLLQNIQYFSKPHQNEHLIKLVQNRNLEDSEVKYLLSSILKKIESFEKYENLEMNDLCIMIVQFYPFLDTHKLKFNVLFPCISFTYQQMQPLKLVSNPLCILLTSKSQEAQKFLCGFLTMDQKKRIMPLNMCDKLCLKYPLVGIWVKGVENEISLNINTWAACIRFIETQVIHNKFSPFPELNCFLLVNFTSRSLFYEVQTSGKPVWNLITKVLQPNNNTIEFISNDTDLNLKERNNKKSLTASTNTSEGKFSGIRSSLDFALTEKKILSQNLIIKNLERQINDIKQVMSADRLINSATNTTSFLHKRLSPDILNTSQKRKQKEKYINNHDKLLRNELLRSSCKINVSKLPKDATFTVPKIIYQSDNDSYEDESIIEW